MQTGETGKTEQLEKNKNNAGEHSPIFSFIHELHFSAYYVYNSFYRK